MRQCVSGKHSAGEHIRRGLQSVHSNRFPKSYRETRVQAGDERHTEGEATEHFRAVCWSGEQSIRSVPTEQATEFSVVQRFLAIVQV